MSDHEAFVDKLTEILNQQPAGNLLSVPGVYEILSEEFNNQVLEALEGERQKAVDFTLYNCCTGLREPDWSGFTGLEVSGSIDNDGETEAMISADRAGFYTIYGRLKEFGGIGPITDCPEAADVLAVGTRLSLISGLPVTLHPSLAQED